jgi:DNA-binding NtrC family response regulator
VLLASGDEITPDVIMLSAEESTESAPANDVVITDETLKAGMVGNTLAEMERKLIIDTVSHTLGNRTHAANILGISLRTLRNKLRQYSAEGHAVPPPPVGEADREAESA